MSINTLNPKWTTLAIVVAVSVFATVNLYKESARLQEVAAIEKDNAQEAERLASAITQRGTGPQNTDGPFKVISNAVKDHNLDDHLDQLRPDGEGGYAGELKSTSFVKAISFIGGLEEKGLKVTALLIEQTFKKDGVDVSFEVNGG